MTGHLSLWQRATSLTHQNNKEQRKESLEMFLSVVLVEEHRANQSRHYWWNTLETFCQHYYGNDSIVTGLTGFKFLKTQLKKTITLTKMSFASSFDSRVWHKPRPPGLSGQRSPLAINPKISSWFSNLVWHWNNKDSVHSNPFLG